MNGNNKKTLVQTSSFKTDFKKISRSGRYKIDDFKTIVEHLLNGQSLQEKYKDHQLVGEWEGYRECHIKPDWLLIYKNNSDCLTLVRMGSHSDLFN